MRKEIEKDILWEREREKKKKGGEGGGKRKEKKRKDITCKGRKESIPTKSFG